MTYDYTRLKKIKCFLFDMDGTINLGNELIPGMEGFFDRLKAAGRDYYLLTNNSSRSHEHYVSKMNGLGVPVSRQNILISSDALTNWMQKNKPGARLFVLGTPQLLATVAAAGFTLTNTLEDGVLQHIFRQPIKNVQILSNWQSKRIYKLIPAKS